MNIHHLLSGGLLIALVSCAVEMGEIAGADDTEKVINKSDSSGGPYPPPSDGFSEGPSEYKPDPWRCGSDWYELKDSQGNSYIIELPIPCDPLADIYRGCPGPDFTMTQEVK